MRAVALIGPVASGTSTLTLLQLLAGTNRELRITEVGISFQGTDNLAEPVQVELLRQSTAGTASSLTVVKGDGSDSNTIDATAQQTFTAEPTAGAILRQWLVHPQSGLIYQPQDKDKLTVPGGARIGLRVVTPDADTPVTAYIEFEE